MLEEFVTKLAFEDELEKIASGPSVLKYMGYSAGGIAAAAGVGEVIDLFQSVLSNKRKKKAYEKMIETTPELKKYPPQKVLVLFDGLWNANPTVAANPMFASGFMVQQLRMGDLAASIPALEQVSKIQQRPGPATFRDTAMISALGDLSKAPGEALSAAEKMRLARYGR